MYLYKMFIILHNFRIKNKTFFFNNYLSYLKLHEIEMFKLRIIKSTFKPFMKHFENFIQLKKIMKTYLSKYLKQPMCEISMLT